MFSSSKIGCRVKFATLESAYKLLEHHHLELTSGVKIEVKPYFSQSYKRALTFFKNLKSENTPMGELHGFPNDNKQEKPSCMMKAIHIRRSLILEANCCENEQNFSETQANQVELSRFSGSIDRSRYVSIQGTTKVDQDQNLRFNLRMRH